MRFQPTRHGVNVASTRNLTMCAVQSVPGGVAWWFSDRATLVFYDFGLAGQPPQTPKIPHLSGGDPAIASLQNLPCRARVLHLPRGHAALSDHARQRTSAGGTCASGAASHPRPALSPRRRKAWGTCGSRSSHGFVGVGGAHHAVRPPGQRVSPPGQRVRPEDGGGGGVPHPPFATLAGGGAPPVKTPTDVPSCPLPSRPLPLCHRRCP